jgi:hypothetical protein
MLYYITETEREGNGVIIFSGAALITPEGQKNPSAVGMKGEGS